MADCTHHRGSAGSKFGSATGIYGGTGIETVFDLQPPSVIQLQKWQYHHFTCRIDAGLLPVGLWPGRWRWLLLLLLLRAAEEVRRGERRGLGGGDESSCGAGPPAAPRESWTISAQIPSTREAEDEVSSGEARGVRASERVLGRRARAGRLLLMSAMDRRSELADDVVVRRALALPRPARNSSLVILPVSHQTVSAQCARPTLWMRVQGKAVAEGGLAVAVLVERLEQ